MGILFRIRVRIRFRIRILTLIRIRIRIRIFTRIRILIFILILIRIRIRTRGYAFGFGFGFEFLLWFRFGSAFRQRSIGWWSFSPTFIWSKSFLTSELIWPMKQLLVVHLVNYVFFFSIWLMVHLAASNAKSSSPNSAFGQMRNGHAWQRDILVTRSERGFGGIWEGHCEPVGPRQEGGLADQSGLQFVTIKFHSLSSTVQPQRVH